ncbi:MAG: hypothetical protein ACLGPL_02735 [Acidobacteriota bacterium]
MEALKSLLRENTFLILLFCLGLLALNWPMFDMHGTGGPMSILTHAFLVWLVLILFLFLIGKSFRTRRD